MKFTETELLWSVSTAERLVGHLYAVEILLAVDCVGQRAP